MHRWLVLFSICGWAACREKTAATPPPLVAVEDAASPPPAAAVDAATFAEAASPVALPDVETDWCLPPFRGLDEATCYLLPEESKGKTTLLLYLSGIVPPTPKVSPQKENVQRIVSSAAKRAGAAVLLPRGRRGIGPADAKDWWAWPTSASDYAAHAKAIVLEWKAAREKLERLTGVKIEHTYLAGSSSGAYFLTALALANGVSDLSIDGFAATSGGSPGMLGGAASSVEKRPFYVGYASGDPTSTGPKALAAFLTARGWPVQSKEHPGGHGAREEYLNEAFAYWAASAAPSSH